MVVIRMLCCLVLALVMITNVSNVNADVTKKQSTDIHKKKTILSDNKKHAKTGEVSNKNIKSKAVTAKTVTSKPAAGIAVKSATNKSVVRHRVASLKNNSSSMPRASKMTVVDSGHAVSKTVKASKNIVGAHERKPLQRKSRSSKAMASLSAAPSQIDINQLHFSSRSVMVYDDASNRVLYARNADEIVPIASITKLMTATVMLDAHLPMHTPITVTDEDVDMLRHSSSRLPVGAVLPRRELLRLSLMSSENRATHALARTYPGGVQACVAAMNRKAASLGMHNTFFADPTGLYSSNRSTAHDLMILVKNSYQYELIQEFTTTPECKVASNRGCIAFRNTNPLVREGHWDIELSKTGFINEAGLCMVMKANIAERPVIIVLLDANSKEGRLQDANNIKRWIEAGTRHALTAGYGFRRGEKS